MMNYSDGSDTQLCLAVNGIIERHVSGENLSVDEHDILKEHMEHCQQCRDLWNLTFGLPVFAEATVDGENDRAIALVLEKLHEARELERRRTTRWTAVAIGGSVAAAALFGMWLWMAPQRVGPEPLTTLHCDASPRTELTAGVFMTWCDGDEPGTVVEGGAVRVSLKNGTVALSVDPERPNKGQVSVTTARGEVRVKGTVFAVHVASAQDRVEVFRGIVEVIPSRNTLPPFFVQARQGGRLTGRGGIVDSGPMITGVLIQALESDAVDEPENTEAVSAGSVAPSGPSEEEASASVEQNGKNGLELRHENGANIRHSAVSVDELMENARSCMLVQDWECAASRYQKVLKTHSRSPESTTVLISLAKIELRHLNSPQKALSHYNAYLQKNPNGPLAEEALSGSADSYRRLGLETQEAQTLRRFIEKYPNSSLTGKVRLRLAQLDRRNGANHN